MLGKTPFTKLVTERTVKVPCKISPGFMSRIDLLAEFHESLAMFGHPNQRLRTNHVRTQVSINQILHGSSNLLRIIGDNASESRIEPGVASAKARSGDDRLSAKQILNSRVHCALTCRQT